MSRVAPTPVEVHVDGAWVRGVVRTCQVAPDRSSCTAVVSYGPTDCVTTGRFEASLLRQLDGTPGCPADHVDCGCAAPVSVGSRALSRVPGG